MTLTLEIAPEVQAELERQAAIEGRPVEAYAAGLLEKAAEVAPIVGSKEPAGDMLELFAPLRGLNIDFERDRDPGRDIQL